MTATNEILSNLDIKYHFLIDNILDVVGELDLNGVFTYVNPYINNELGYQPSDIIGRELYEFVHPDDAKKITKILLRRSKSHDFILEIRLKNDKNQFIWYEIRARRVKDSNNQRKILITLKNISKVKVLEEKLEKKEENLRNSEKKYKNLSIELDTIMDIIPSMIYVKNKSEIYTFVNQVFADYLKLEKEDIIGKSTFDLFPQEVATNLKRDDLEVIKNGIPKLNVEKTVEFPIGKVSEIISKIPYYNEKDEINGIIGFAIDISERKELEQKLKESEEKYRMLINNLTDIILELDIKGTVTYVSPQCYNIMGYQPAEIIGKKVMRFIHPDDVMLIAEIMKKATQTNEVMTVSSYRLIHKNGDSIYVTASGRYVNLGGIEKFVVAIRDDRKNKKLEKEIKLERDNLINILSSMEDGVYIVDKNYDIEYINPTLIEEFGLHEGKKCYSYFHDREEICPLCKNQEVLKGNTVRWEWFSEKNQKTYDLLDTPLKNKDGSVSILEICRDITEHKKVEKQLRVFDRITSAFLTISEDEIYGEILQIILDALDSKHGVFGYINDKGDYVCPSMTRDLWKKCQMQDKTMTFPRSSWGGMWGKAMLDRKTICANKTFILPEDHIQIQNVLDVPIIHHGELIGNVMIGNKENGYDENDVKLLESIVNKITPILYHKLRIKKEEQKLKETEEKFRTAVNNSPNYIVFIKRDGTILEVNRLEKGFTREMVIGQNVFNENFYETKENIESVRKAISNSLESGETTQYEHSQIAPDGSFVFYETKVSPFEYDDEDRIISLQLTTSEITERKKAEQKLKESEERYRSLVEDSQEGIWALDINENTIFVNPRICEMFGYTKNEMMGKNLHLLIPDSMEERIKGNRIRREKGIKETYDLELLKKDGTIIYTNIKAAPIMSESWEYKGSFAYITDITAQKHAEEILRESEEKYKNLFDQAPMAILLLNFEGVIENCNTSTKGLFGYTKEELLGKEYLKFDIFPLGTKTILVQSFSKFLKTGVPEHSEIQMYRKDGEMIWINSYPIVIKIAGTSYILALLQDISERKKAEQKLKESEEKYRLLFENANDAISIHDLDGNFYEVNDLYCSRLGYTREEILKLNIRDFNTPEYADLVTNRILDVTEKGFKIFEAAHKAKDGRIIPVEISAKSILYDNKPFIFSIIRDLTERKNAEQKLIESEAKHRGLLETAVMGIVEYDVENNLISYINPKLLEILGYSKEDLLVEKMLLKIIHPEDLKELIESREDKYVEFRVFTKDGSLKWLSGTRNNLFNQAGKLISTRLWLQDSTESKEVEEIKSNLLTRFSHEFKTPLISITGFADFLLTEHKTLLDKKTLLFLKRIKDGSDKLKKLINSFVESSQLDKSTVRLNLRKENLYDLIFEVLDELEGLKQLRKHEIDLNIDKQLITSLDKEKVYTVITNLLTNALNYTPKGAIISIESKIEKKSIIISIKDTGIGLDENEKIRLFKPFGKIERYGKGWDIDIGGMGMGLFISKEIVELHEGKIWAESEGRNQGSTFYFSIPITK